MIYEGLYAVLDERERVAHLAELCQATYDWKFQPQSFATRIRTGDSVPPWFPAALAET